MGRSVPMVAVFDTAFHQTMPEVAKQYALPAELANRYRIQRYGFHGIAHASLAEGYAAYTGNPLEQVRLITLQLGNGCSVAANRASRRSKHRWVSRRWRVVDGDTVGDWMLHCSYLSNEKSGGG